MTGTSPRAERIATIVAAAASIWFALAAAWGLFGPLPGGHLGNAAGAAIGGENMLRWRIFAAVIDYLPRAPTPPDYYTHHPYGVFVDEAVAHALFGHHWATVRLPGVVMSALSPPLVFLVARALWRAVPAAVATVAFTVVPIDLAFASFHNLEGDTIFWGLVFSWGTVRLFQTWRGVWLVPSTIGALGACQSDWVGLVLVGTVGAFAFVRAYVLPSRVFGRVGHAAHARWFALATVAAVGTLLLYLVLFAKAGKLGDLLGSYESRSAGNQAALSAIFGPRRRMWLTWMLPSITLVAIAVGAVLHVARTLVPQRGVATFATRRAEEVVPLAWLAAASFQYFVFRQGADVHVFWPHYYGAVAAFGFGAIARTALDAIDRFAPALDERIALALPLVPIGVCLLLVLRVGVVLLRQSHLTGGRFDDGGRFIAVDEDRSAFSAWVATKLPKDAIVGVHKSFLPNWYVEYGLHRPMQPLATIPGRTVPSDRARVFLADASNATPAELRQMAAEHAIDFVGPFLRVDRASAPGLVAHRYVERQPGFFGWYFSSGTDLSRTIGDDVDPWHTWEWRTHLGLPGDPPDLAPRDAEEARIAFDAAIERGDRATAESLRARATSIVHPMEVPYTGDLRLLGVAVDEGAATVMTLLWETGPGFHAADLDYLVRSKVLAAPPLWASAIDYFEKEVSPRMPLRPGLWKPEHLYVDRFVAMKRVGTERFEGFWVSNAGGAPPRAIDGRERVELFVLR